MLSDRQRRTLAELEQKVDRLPLLPAVVERLAWLDPDSSEFSDDVQALAASDPAFAVLLVRSAGRRSVREPAPTLTLSQAVVRVGTVALRELVTAHSVARVFVPSTRPQRELWVHALQTAVAARALAALAPELRVAPEEAYLAGLLHDIGRFVMFDHSPDELGRVDETCWRTPSELHAADLELCGYSHAELGARACELWGLPEAIAIPIRWHHDYGSLVGRCPPELESLERIVQQADHLSVAMMRHPGWVDEGAAGRRRIARAADPFPDGRAAPCPADRWLGRLDTLLAEAAELATALRVVPPEPTPAPA